MHRLRGVFLFIGVLPLVNALFDWISLGVTLALVRLGYLRGWLAVLCGVGDLAFAALLFLASGCTLIAVVHGMNVATGVEFVPLAELLADLGDLRTYWWIYAMVFSTALPTVLHAALCLASLTSWSLGQYRLPVARLVARAPHDVASMAAAPLLLTLIAAAWAVVCVLGAVLVIGAIALVVDWATAHPLGPAETAAGWLHGYFNLFTRFATLIGAVPAA